MKGYQIALTEVFVYFLIAYTIKDRHECFQALHPVVYYWSGFTFLTGIWELFFVSEYNHIVQTGNKLIQDKTTVWTSDYPFYYILPNLLPKIFYAEYGAHADREYLLRSNHNYWARLIESSHGLWCGSFSLAALVLTYLGECYLSAGCSMIAMGGQFMNSLLYMGQYQIQCNDPESVNFYDTKGFPTGKWLSKRWFMWVNVFWFLFPSIIITLYLSGKFYNLDYMYDMYLDYPMIY